MRTPNILTIAGSDSGGGAGIQADLKTIMALGGYGMSVITALTAQNGLGVTGIHAPGPEFVVLQLRAVLDGFPVHAAKTGMLFSAGIINALADALRDAGVDVAVLANNHCCDNGAEGIRTSVEELDRYGIRHTGAFADSADYKKNNPLYLTYCGIRLAIVNYTYGTNGMPVPEGTVVNLIDTVRMAADLAAARASGVDFIVACVHWGDEYQRRENAAQRSLAAFLRRHGTDVVVGSHPHVIQPWVADSSHVVLYSLGNLVSGQRRRYTDGGLVATVEAVRHPEGRMTYRLETTPVWVSVPGYRILTPEAADTMTLPAAYGIFRADLDALPGNGL